MRVLFCVFCMSIHWRSPPPPLHATNKYFLLQVFFKDTLYFLLNYLSTFCPVVPKLLWICTRVKVEVINNN
jgi:hypothetical protein